MYYTCEVHIGVPLGAAHLLTIPIYGKTAHSAASKAAKYLARPKDRKGITLNPEDGTRRFYVLFEGDPIGFVQVTEQESTSHDR